MGVRVPGRDAVMSHILHGFTDPKYLDVVIAKTQTQIRESTSDEDRHRFEAYLQVLLDWKGKMGHSVNPDHELPRQTCTDE